MKQASKEVTADAIFRLLRHGRRELAYLIAGARGLQIAESFGGSCIMWLNDGGAQ